VLMIYRVGVEDIEPNHWLGWVLDLPGCFSAAASEAEAIARVPAAIAAYYAWLARQDSTLPLTTGPGEVRVVESFRAFSDPNDPTYLVNAFFEEDRRPLSYWDVTVALRLLDWTRQELQQVLRPATPEQLAGPIGKLVKHIANAENWYFSRLALGLDPSHLPPDPVERLAAVRANARSQLIYLIGDEQIASLNSEQWSARKILRRTLWHERDHTRQLRQLLVQR
jgi:predicted RNase H-like HicB family nuclease